MGAEKPFLGPRRHGKKAAKQQLKPLVPNDFFQDSNGAPTAWGLHLQYFGKGMRRRLDNAISSPSSKIVDLIAMGSRSRWICRA
jgi:hypothetical protein